MTTDSSAAPASKPARVLSLAEKRGIAYARLSADLRGSVLTKPGQMQELEPEAIAKIEQVMSSKQFVWPWAVAVLEFIESPEYQAIEASVLAEIAKEQARWNEIARREESKRETNAAHQAVAADRAKTRSSDSKGSWDSSNSPYWGDKDPNWWREQT